jgi:uncharacterized heparinase superfamily protein
MVPEIKSYSLASGEALQSYKPENYEKFNLALRLIIGPRGQPGEESFDVTVCKPASLAEECSTFGVVLGRHRLIVSAYDPSQILAAITKLVASCDGESWQ